ncbi:hypothetical protein [Bradyrhizobium sp. 6(2017)]|uniref:hypothetical protein n=1 Tax=Bradyrhizobium sp. 6(2017) TaxID=1197460 RepID=UPI0013E118E7|nr:hypothetical protein [Bradyrhizobium sp. 6(2017)]QIG98985.1 hypothetical protein G6P99_46910 [Bradyrhizobium sp. 6(2017)]
MAEAREMPRRSFALHPADLLRGSKTGHGGGGRAGSDQPNVGQPQRHSRNAGSAFPDQIAQAEARASCVIKATELARPLLPFPELLDRENALRKALAGQVQARTMSLLERNVQIQKLHSQLLDEERSRQSAAPADAGKPSLAVAQWRQSNPESCGRLGGDSAGCF